MHDLRTDARRDRFVLTHAATDLASGLVHDDDLVLADASGEQYAGRVVDVYLDEEDTTYVVLLGARLPPEVAARRTDVQDDVRGDAVGRGEDKDEDEDEVLALLDALRRQRGRPGPDGGPTPT